MVIWGWLFLNLLMWRVFDNQERIYFLILEKQVCYLTTKNPACSFVFPAVVSDIHQPVHTFFCSITNEEPHRFFKHWAGVSKHTPESSLRCPECEGFSQATELLKGPRLFPRSTSGHHKILAQLKSRFKATPEHFMRSLFPRDKQMGGGGIRDLTFLLMFS